MKIREGFVSNSSSSSFIVSMHKITGLQLKQILEHAEAAKQFGMTCEVNDEFSDEWAVHIGPEYVQVSTLMDNFDMHHFLRCIGVADEDIREVDYGTNFTSGDREW